MAMVPGKRQQKSIQSGEAKQALSELVRSPPRKKKKTNIRICRPPPLVRSISDWPFTKDLQKALLRFALDKLFEINGIVKEGNRAIARF
jgi:hypothetical protein